jgi:hypothetical protein
MLGRAVAAHAVAEAALRALPSEYSGPRPGGTGGAARAAGEPRRAAPDKERNGRATRP